MVFFFPCPWQLMNHRWNIFERFNSQKKRTISSKCVMWIIIEQEMCWTEAAHASYFELSIVLEVLDWFLSAWKAASVLKIDLWRMVCSAALRDKIITLQSELVSHPLNLLCAKPLTSWQHHHSLTHGENWMGQTLEVYSHTLWEEGSKDASSYLFIALRRGLSLSWMILVLPTCKGFLQWSGSRKFRTWEEPFRVKPNTHLS